MAMKAYVLVETNAGKTKGVKKALGKLKPGKCRIESLDVVTGPFDYIAVVQGPTLDDIGQLVTEGIGAIEGVTRTTTCLAMSIG
jgi:DNA-binding Lrp family transcriptional regulator